MSVNIIRCIVLVIIMLVLSCEEYFLPIEGCTNESACKHSEITALSIWTPKKKVTYLIQKNFPFHKTNK